MIQIGDSILMIKNKQLGTLFISTSTSSRVLSQA